MTEVLEGISITVPFFFFFNTTVLNTKLFHMLAYDSIFKVSLASQRLDMKLLR